jgi:hypothetical protein
MAADDPRKPPVAWRGRARAAGFCPVLPDSARFCQVLPDSAKFCPILARFCPVLTAPGGFGPRAGRAKASQEKGMGTSPLARRSWRGAGGRATPSHPQSLEATACVKQETREFILDCARKTGIMIYACIGIRHRITVEGLLAPAALRTGN